MVNESELLIEQRRLCDRYGAKFVACPLDLKVGISSNVRDGVLPFNGLRHPMTSETTEWYLWGGEHLSSRDDFFLPLHGSHLRTWRPELLVYLGLAPGWRFLIADNHEDVWFDESLLAITH